MEIWSGSGHFIVKVTEGVLLYAQLSCLYSNKKLRKFLGQIWNNGWNFSIKLEKDSVRGFQIMTLLKKHSSQAQTAPSLVFTHRGEPGYEQNCLTKLLPLPSLFPTKAQLSFLSPTIPMEMLEQPKKKASYLHAIF